MTWLPQDARSVVGFISEPYPLNDFCPVPGCPNPATERHHLWRKSFLIGDYWWVKLADDRVIGNCVGLCNRHHEEITVNKAKIEFDGDVFLWDGLSIAPRMLDWQPPEQARGEFVPTKYQRTGDHMPDRSPLLTGTPSAPEVNVDHDSETHLKNVCPTCNRRMPKEKVDSPDEPVRIRKTWAVSVPMDVRENGADVLDENLEHIRELLADAGMEYGESSAAKYFVLSTALALFITHHKEIL